MTTFQDIMIENKLFEYDLVYRYKNVLMPRPIRSKRVTKFINLMAITHNSILVDVWSRYKELGSFLSLEAIDVDEDLENEDEDEDEDGPNEYDLNDSFINDEQSNQKTKKQKLLSAIERKKEELQDLEKELEINS